MKNRKNIRLLLFEANASYREIISTNIETAQGFELIGSYSNFWEAEKRVSNLKPDVILVDLDMPSNAPWQALKKILAIRQIPPAARPSIIVLSQYKDDERIIQAYCAGGDISYLLKPVEKQELIGAIRRTVNGDPYANDYISRRSRELLGNPINPTNARRLSKREFIALRLLKQGYTQKEAAAKMGIKSVNDTLKSIYRKLGVHNQRDAENLVWYNHLEIRNRIEEWEG